MLNTSLVYLNPAFVCLQTVPACHVYFPLIQLQNAYYCHTFNPIYFMRRVAAHLIQFTFKMQDSACAMLFVEGGELTSEITP